MMLLSSWLRKPTTDPSQLVIVDAVPRDLWRALEDGNVPPFHQALPQLAYEVARARRYERPLSLALFAVDAVSSHPSAGVETADGAPLTAEAALAAQAVASSALMTVLLATLLRETLRESDIVTYAPSFAICLVGMPETGAIGARCAVVRVQAVCLERLLRPVRAGVAEFSKSGWTLEELIRQAEADALQPASAPPPLTAAP